MRRYSIGIISLIFLACAWMTSCGDGEGILPDRELTQRVLSLRVSDEPLALNPEPLPEPIPTATPTPSPSPTPTPLPTSEPGDEPVLEACLATNPDAPIQAVQLSGRDHQVRVAADGVVLVRVTGRDNGALIIVEDSPEGTLGGLCVFLAGDRARATIIARSALPAIAIVGRGNQAQATVVVEETGSLGGGVVDLAGNKGEVTISGDGPITCPIGRLTGHETRMVCEP